MNTLQADFEFYRNLQPGDRVIRLWTWNFGNYSDTATVERVNGKSVRVRLDGNTYLGSKSVPSPSIHDWKRHSEANRLRPIA